MRPSPTSEDLTVFYMPDTAEWLGACADMLSAGFIRVTSPNPYWDIFGRTFEGRDGYRVVLQNAAWEAACAE